MSSLDSIADVSVARVQSMAVLLAMIVSSEAVLMLLHSRSASLVSNTLR